MAVSPEAVDQVIAAIPEEVLNAVVDRQLALRRETKLAERLEARDRQGDAKQPGKGRYAAVRSGRHRRKLRPQASPDDRQYVAGALRHWRRVHGLSYREAQARIGYSPKSCSWRHWEEGFVSPPYRTLLAIIAATGLGYWKDNGTGSGVADELRLDVVAAQWNEEIRRRRARRRTSRS